MTDDVLFVKGVDVTDAWYRKHITGQASISDRDYKGVETHEGFLFVKGVDKIKKSPKSGIIRTDE